MSEQASPSAKPEDKQRLPHVKLPRFRWILLGALGVFALLWVIPTVLTALRGLDIQIDYPYGLISFLVTFDAVIPILPSESVLHVGAVKAVDGELELWVTIFAASVGAIVGDSLLYWITRTIGHEYFSHKLEAAKKNEKVAIALSVFGNSAPLLIVLGRYVPGVRFVVNGTMGLTKYPYPRFLLFSVIGGVGWAVYTLAISYWVGEKLSDYPVLSFATGIAFTSAIVGILFFVLKRRYKREQQQQADEDAGDAPQPPNTATA